MDRAGSGPEPANPLIRSTAEPPALGS